VHGTQRSRRGLLAASLGVVALAVAAAGCGGGSSSSSSAATTAPGGSAAGSSQTAASGALNGNFKNTKVKKIAFFGFAAANSFAQATWAGVQQAAKQYGAQAKFFDPNFNAQTQVSQIQDAITTGQYQVFVVQANDGNAVVPVVKQAIKAGITVVGEFTPVGTKYDTIQPQVPGLYFVGEAPVTNGHNLGKLGIEACKGINPCKLVYMQGFKSLPLDNARTAAVLQTLKSAKNVKVVASPEGGYTQASGLKAAQDVLQAHPDVNVIIGSSQAIEGAQQAVKSAGKLGKIKLIGNGGSCQAVKGVKAGNWFAAYVLPEKTSGYKATQIGVAAANGAKVPHAFNTDQLQNPLGTKQVLTSTHFKAQYCD
jgi:ribose transport system substrate-binding protein